MSTVKRFSYSLLISTLAFTVFSVIAFSGLFPWLEVQFYSPKVVSTFQSRLDVAQTAVEVWKKETLRKVESLLGDDSFNGLFSPTASRESIQKRYLSSKLFLRGFHGDASIRVLNSDLSQLHFSSEDTDIKTKSDFSLTYRLRSEVVGIPELPTSLQAGEWARIVAEPLSNRVFFFGPWKDQFSGTTGYFLLGVSLEDLRDSLDSGAGGWGDGELFSLGGDRGFLISLVGQRLDRALQDRLRDTAIHGILPPFQRLAALGSLNLALVSKNGMAVLVPMGSFEMDPILKGLLLISFFTVVFLISFLLANLRGEPLSVVSRKVKRFQLQVVRQYLDVKEKDKLVTLREELARHTDEIQADVKRSLGRVRKKDREWVDRYIDTSWQEVLELLRAPANPVSESGYGDWKRLEALLQQALTQGRFVVSTSQPEVFSASTTNSVPRGAANFSTKETKEEKLEELAEEVEEALEPVEELEELSDDAEELVEELDAAELSDVEELTPEDPDDLQELEEAPRDEADLIEEISETVNASPETFKKQNDLPKQCLEAGGEDEELEELEIADGNSVRGGQDEDVSEVLKSEDQENPAFHLRNPSENMATTMNLTPSEDSDLPELEEDTDELEELDEETAVASEIFEESISLERLDIVWGASQNEVFTEVGGVVSLRDDVFSDAAKPVDDFSELVDGVISGIEERTFVPLEEDLVPLHLSREWKWTGGGFDWDRFAQKSDEVSLFRALSEIVTELDAFTAAILTDTTSGWLAQSSVGFSDSGKELLTFSADSPLGKGYLSIRALHILKGGGGHPVVRQSFHPKDLKFMKAILCVPILFRHESAWLLLGLRKEPDDLMRLLAPRQVV